MLTSYEKVKKELSTSRHTWLVTGVAGFIGSHLLEQLLGLGQNVVGLDNLSTGNRRNLKNIQQAVGAEAWSHFRFLEGDICQVDQCKAACEGVDYVLHQAALGSVPRSIAYPTQSHDSNVNGFVRLIEAARLAGVRRIVYASSSSVYGDHPGLPKIESLIGRPLSPYAATKLIDEIYADVFTRTYGISCIGLRYFNVFGPRQRPDGAYAAVIPKWFDAVLSNHNICINGDANNSRDFCFVANVHQANLLAAVSRNATEGVFNIACGNKTSLGSLIEMIREVVAADGGFSMPEVIYGPPREGDVRHSLANISAAKERLGYEPEIFIRDGLAATWRWFRTMHGK